MFSATRLFIGLALFIAYIFAIIALFAQANTGLYLVLLFAGVGVFLYFTATGRLTTPAHVKRIQAHGVEATATILEMRDTGLTVNKSPYVNFRLMVQPATLPPYETNLKTLVSRIAIPRVGDTIRVKYDPDKPQDVIVV